MRPGGASDCTNWYCPYSALNLLVRRLGSAASNAAEHRIDVVEIGAQLCDLLAAKTFPITLPRSTSPR